MSRNTIFTGPERFAPTMPLEPLETAEGSDAPLCRQLSVFVENRLGQLLRLTRLFEQADTDLHLCGLSVESAVDYAIVRMLVNDAESAYRMLTDAGFAVTNTDVLVVELPPGRRGLMTVCVALISGEININYTYPLLPDPERAACMAFQVDNPTQAANVLRGRKFRVLDQSEL